MARTLQERFDEKYIPEPMSGCWLWIGAIYDRRLGYGKISVDGKRQYAHRMSWELHNDRLAGKGHVLHKCDNPTCVNPAHLYLGDQAQNNRDRDERGRHVALRGTHNGMAKLTDSQIREIRDSSLSSIRIAPSFGVDPATIRTIRRRETWAYVK